MDSRGQSDRSGIVRVGCAYLALLSVSGFNQPFFPIWLEVRGLSEWQISLVMSAPLLLRLFVTPAIGSFADRSGRRNTVIRILSVLVLATALILSTATSFWPIIVLFSITLVMYQAIGPIVDAAAVSLVRQGRATNFGRMRLWGSLGYASAALLGGQILAFGGSDAVYMAFCAAILATVVAVFALPEAQLQPLPEKEKDVRLTRQPLLVTVFVVTALVLSSQTAFNIFGSIYLKSIGYSDRAIGLMWALATSSEIVMFWAGPRVSTVLGPFGLLSLAAGASVVRWSLMAFAPSLPMLVLLQMSHAATFSGSHLGLQKFMQFNVHDRRGATAQSAFVTLLGLITAGATLAVGPLYHLLGSGVFLCAAAMPTLALVLLLVVRTPLRASVPQPQADAAR
ncbi:MFS transporter [uncultured Alsobacter sp.]|uniref:MFS transporter n=1 Tax=uncultured Alsobacter sp. TaxID=1748258 RepID=UPI0025D8DEAB|nr:MFS transporter [uncultured Alsobacter sp.]